MDKNSVKKKIRSLTAMILCAILVSAECLPAMASDDIDLYLSNTEDSVSLISQFGARPEDTPPDNSSNFAFDVSTGTLTIKDDGVSMIRNDPQSLPWYQIRESVKHIIIKSDVTELPGYSFYGMTNLIDVRNYGKSQTIKIPDGAIIKTGETASGDHTIYSSATELFDVIQRDETVTVYAFINDDSATTYETVPSESCGYSLVNLTVAEGQCGDNLHWAVTIENNLIISGYGEMWNYKKGTSPFASYSASIQNIELPKNITSIGDFAFEGLNGVFEIEQPAYLYRLGRCAFKDCDNLTKFKLTARMTDIKSGVFAGCTRLTELTVNNASVNSLNDGYLVNTAGEVLGYLRNSVYCDVKNRTVYSSETSATIPDGMLNIGGYTFYNITTAAEVTIPSSVTTIDDEAFINATNLSRITNMANFEQVCGTDIFSGTGSALPSTVQKQAVVYKANTDFAEKAQKAGYDIVWMDDLKMQSISAVYTGGPVIVGQNYSPSDVLVSIIYSNGTSSNVTAAAAGMTLSSTTVSTIGDNKFTVLYEDGYGNSKRSNEFTVQGSNAIKSVSFDYIGPSVWAGEDYNPKYVTVTVVYTNNTSETIKGDKKNASSISYVSYNTLTAEKAGENRISATYTSDSGKTYSGNFTVMADKYATKIEATYPEDKYMGLGEGISGVDLDSLSVYVEYSDNTSDTLSGDDSNIIISDNVDTIGSKTVFTLTLSEKNKNKLTANFNVNCDTNISSMECTYIGQSMTQNSVISPEMVQVKLVYTNGKITVTTGDTLTGFSIPNGTITNPDGIQEIDVSYGIGGNTFTDSVQVPIRGVLPYKLVIVKRPTVYKYDAGDAFDPDGMIINCLFDDNTSIDVTDVIEIPDGDSLTANQKVVTLSYYHSGSNTTITAKLAISMSDYEHVKSTTLSFAEQYEITKILFRSKATEDETYSDDVSNVVSTESDRVGKWIDITPVTGSSSIASSDVQAKIKSGYGFDMKVFVKYKTNRAGEEFKDFMAKTYWDSKFVSEDESSGRWKYLNDVYPQYTPTASPDILYLRITSGLVDSGGTSKSVILNTGKDGASDFIILEKTNISESGEEEDEGEWYNSTKIFEPPLRDVTSGETGTERRIYTSRDAANPDAQYTDYVVQIISPAWYGYEQEPMFDGSKFIYSDDEKWPAELSKYWQLPSSPYLHVCASFKIRVITNDDIHTHILQ